MGTALKVNAGTPDFDDFEGLKFQQQELIASQNQQISQQEQINNLTDAVNLIIKNAKAQQIDTAHLYEILLERNRITISEIETLISTITLAKIGVINTLILDSNDAKNITSRHSTNETISD